MLDWRKAHKSHKSDYILFYKVSPPHPSYLIQYPVFLSSTGYTSTLRKSSPQNKFHLPLSPLFVKVVVVRVLQCKMYKKRWITWKFLSTLSKQLPFVTWPSLTAASHKTQSTPDTPGNTMKTNGYVTFLTSITLFLSLTYHLAPITYLNCTATCPPPVDQSDQYSSFVTNWLEIQRTRV